MESRSFTQCVLIYANSVFVCMCMCALAKQDGELMSDRGHQIRVRQEQQWRRSALVGMRRESGEEGGKESDDVTVTLSAKKKGRDKGGVVPCRGSR